MIRRPRAGAPAPHDPRVTQHLRERHAPPGGDAYWSALEERLLARVAAPGEAVVEWWGVLDGWRRAGAIAAAVALVAALVTARHERVASARVAYEGAMDTPAAERTATDGGSGRDATLSYVISH